MRLSIYGNSDKRVLEDIATSVYSLENNEYKIIREEGNENQFSLFVMATRVIPPIIKVRISTDMMQVHVSLYQGLNSKESIDDVQVEKYVKNFGVIDEFIDKLAITEACKLLESNYIVQNFLIAQGIPAINGEKCVIEKMFSSPETMDLLNRPPDGRVDYKSFNSFVLVSEGELLLRRKPATEGVEGKNLKGELIKPIHGEDKVLDVGEGVNVNDDDTEFRAKYNGQVVFENNKISVLPVLAISGDVDLRVGNLSFEGTIHVSGNVLPGFSVVGDNVVIEGVVENADITAKQTITIKTGRKGVGKGTIKAGGDITIGYCENGEMFSEGNIEIQKYCYNSVVSAERIVTTSTDSVLSGGYFRAFSEIKTSTLGSNVTNDMTVYVGVSPTIEEKAKKVMAEIENVNISLQKISDIIKKIDIVNTDAMKDPKLRKLLDTVMLFKRRLPLLQKKYDELIKQSMHPDPKVIVENEVKAGVRIKIFNYQMVLKNNMARVEFYLDKDTHEIGFRNL